MCTYSYVLTINVKEAINVKESVEGYMVQQQGRKRKGKAVII